MKSPDKRAKKLRVAFLAGTLGLGGAEKQLFYMARALREAGAIVFVYCLTRGEFYEKKLEEIGCHPTFLGKHSFPLKRLVALIKQTLIDKPDILQSAHFYTNLYVYFAGMVSRNLVIGAIRNDTLAELMDNKFWGKLLLKSPSSIIANSSIAEQNAKRFRKKTIAVLPNVIDLSDYPQPESLPQNSSTDEIIVATVARLKKMKKIEDFLNALAIARKSNQNIQGLIIGDGPERSRLESRARELSLVPEGVKFLGLRDDIPTLLSQVDIFCLTSQHEGFPNVILEAMASSLPIVTTPAGEIQNIVEDGNTGLIIPHNSPVDMASRIVELARSREKRREMGNNGRKRVENLYSFNQLAENLITIYQKFAHTEGNQRLLRLLNG